MDRIRLSNGAMYPIKDIVQQGERLRIYFYKTVNVAAIKAKNLDVIKLQDRKGRLLSTFKGFNTIIQVGKGYILLERIVYTEAEVNQQESTGMDLLLVESQQSITDGDMVSVDLQQSGTDSDIEKIVSEQSVTDVDIEQGEQGQALTEHELFLLFMEG